MELVKAKNVLPSFFSSSFFFNKLGFYLSLVWLIYLPKQEGGEEQNSKVTRISILIGPKNWAIKYLPFGSFFFLFTSKWAMGSLSPTFDVVSGEGESIPLKDRWWEQELQITTTSRHKAQLGCVVQKDFWDEEFKTIAWNCNFKLLCEEPYSFP